MRRIVAFLIILAQCCTQLPAAANAPIWQTRAVEGPCDLGGRFLAFRADVTKIGEESREAGNVAIRIRRTSRHAPYRHVESLWFDMTAHSKATMKALFDLQNTLDQMPKGKEKAAAAALAIAYQNAIIMFLEYGHYALYDERRANAMSMRFYTIFTTGKAQGTIWITPGLEREKTRMLGEVLSRQFLDQQILEVDSAFHSLKLPEYRYAKICSNSQLSRLESPVPAVDHPCDLVHSLAEAHDSIEMLAREASDAEYVAKRLHRTSRWTPYKRVEADWRDIVQHANAVLNTLSNIPVALDTLSDDTAKSNALALSATYENAVMDIIDTAHYAVFYERVSNATGVSSVDGRNPTFGNIWGSTKSSYDNYSRNSLELKELTINNALRSLKLSEYRYQRACGTFLPASPSTDQAGTENPCTLAGRFADMRTAITELSDEARDLSSYSLHLRATSRWRPYKRIENEWLHLTERANKVLDELSILPIAIDPTPGNVRKQAALNLISADQNAVALLVDYARSALYYERTENSISTNMLRGRPSFGVYMAAVKMNRDNISNADVNSNFLKAKQALRSMKVPAYHYGRLCGASLAAR